MALIIFSDKELHTSSRYRWIPEAICTPGRSPKTPRKNSEKDSELENLLRSAFRLRIARDRGSRTKTEDKKRNSKAQ
jgi:hypothetical protein